MYINEAHAVDEWPISSSRASTEIVNIQAHRNIGERIEAAVQLVKKYRLEELHWSTYVAPMDGTFELVYKCWPIGMYTFQDNMLRFAAEPKNAIFDLQGLQQELNNFCGLNRGLNRGLDGT